MNGRILVLIASEKREIADRIRDILRGKGIGAVTVSDPGEIPEDGTVISPSMILLCGNPGAQIQERCRALSLLLDIPLAILGHAPAPDDVVRRLGEGITYHITDPVENSSLADRIRSIISSARDMHKTPSSRDRSLTLVIQDQARDVYSSSSISRRLLETLRRAEPGTSATPSHPDRVDEGITSADLVHALDENRFILFFQPIVDLGEGRITGFESLVRLNHPERGIVSPDEFIPTAERTGVIHDLGDWITDEASRHLSRWNEIFPRVEPLTVSFNVSATQFTKSDLCDRISRIAEARQVDNGCLRVEVTESTIMGDMEASNLMLLTLKSKGFHLYMDDFGTGYSSLSYLRHFPMDVLKIDKSFVEWIHIDDESEVIVKTIIDLAHNLKMKVIAEGVETAEHLEKLRSYGCDYGQGYYFSRPVPADQAEELLTADPRW